MSVYTGSGDDGKSSTLSEHNISKASPVFETLGSLDECSAALGLAQSYTESKRLTADISFVQNSITAVCGEIASGKQAVSEESVCSLEKMIDGYTAESGGFCGFTTFGITTNAAAVNLARTSVRRAERALAELETTPEMRKYINRLSDLLYVMAQYAAQNSDKN